MPPWRGLRSCRPSPPPAWSPAAPPRGTSVAERADCSRRRRRSWGPHRRRGRLLASLLARGLRTTPRDRVPERVRAPTPRGELRVRTPTLGLPCRAGPGRAGRLWWEFCPNAPALSTISFLTFQYSESREKPTQPPLNHLVPRLFRVLGSRVGGDCFLCFGRRFGLAERRLCL